MQCPVCNVALSMTERQGVEIDYCPQCRGVWLDRGELDKIIERSSETPGVWAGSTAAPGAPSATPPHREESPRREEPPRPERRDAPRYRDDDDDRYDDSYRRRRKKSFLGELFDFD